MIRSLADFTDITKILKSRLDPKSSFVVGEIVGDVTDGLSVILNNFIPIPILDGSIQGGRLKPLERPERRLVHIISKKRICGMLCLSFSILRSPKVIRKARSRCF